MFHLRRRDRGAVLQNLDLKVVLRNTSRDRVVAHNAGSDIVFDKLSVRSADALGINSQELLTSSSVFNLQAIFGDIEHICRRYPFCRFSPDYSTVL